MKFQRAAYWFADLIDHDAPADGPPPQRLGAFFDWCLTGSYRVIAAGSAAYAAVGLSEIAVMVMLGWIADAAIDAGGLGLEFWAAHWPMLAAWVTVLLLIRPLSFGLASTFQSIVVGPSLFKLVLSRLHRHTLGHAVTFFDNDFAGRIAQKQMQTTRALVDVVIETMNALSVAVASALGTVLVVSAINPWLAVLMILWISLYIGFLRFFLPRIRTLSASRAAARAMVTGQIVDTVTNIKTVKLFASSRHEDRAAIEAMVSFRDRAIDWGTMAALFRLGLTVIAGLLPAVMVSASFYLVAQGGASVGELATAGAISIRLAQMTGWISWTLMGIYGNIGEVEDGMRTLAPPHALTDAPRAEELAGPPTIEFRNVSFAYGRRTGGVADICLEVRNGEKLGIVGASGAGKSTLVALLLRLYDTEEGQVLVGDRDVRGVTQESLRRRIGMVTQETAMFNRSARDNILYGRPDAGEEAILDAAKRARAHEFILDLKDFQGRVGYEAFLGERGVKLSGGQRQRIALARAILKDAPILVLDEATSALDSEVEAEIQEALVEVMEGKTVLAIAHRLSTIARMDRIVVLDQGRIVEEGTHHELLARGGLYAQYWKRQSGGFIGLVEAAE
ncbi:MAG: ABC transporter ATP-binding protein [Rhodobacter sp.]|nr:ABC transporter ATP-binding protein [Rhodobacter sp.]